MAECHLCGKRTWSWKFADGLKFCLSCAKKWPDERKQRALNELFAGEQLEELFTIEGVSIQNEDASSVTSMSVGDLVFTNKGICFVHLVAYKRFERILGGIIPIMILDAWRERKVQRKAADKRSEYSKDNSETRLRRLLHETNRLLFFPIGKIEKEIKYRMFGLQIKTDQVDAYFYLPERKKTFQIYEERIRAYRPQRLNSPTRL